MPLTKSEQEQLDQLQQWVGTLIGLALGGPVGGRLGNTAVDAFQMSPFNQFYQDALFSTLPNRPGNELDLADLMKNGSTGDFSSFLMPPGQVPKKKKRKASAYNKRYSRAFKRLAPKFKKKNGSWKKDGFARCAKAARKEAKK